MSIKIKVTCACGEEVAEKAMNDALAHMWKCARCNMVEKGVHNYRLDVYQREKVML